MLLATKYKSLLTDIAQKIIGTPCQIWAYGSRVNGDAHDTSDLDLIIVPIGSATISTDEFVKFKQALEESNIPIIVQVLNWTNVPQNFRENILKNHEVLYKTHSV